MEMSIAYLEQFQALKQEADNLKILLDSVDGVSGVRYSDLPKPEAGPSTLDPIIIKRDKLRRRWRKKYDKVLDMLLVVEQYLDTIDDPMIRTAVREKYINGMTWEQVGESMRYDPSWVRKKVIRYVGLGNGRIRGEGGEENNEDENR